MRDRPVSFYPSHLFEKHADIPVEALLSWQYTHESPSCYLLSPIDTYISSDIRWSSNQRTKSSSIDDIALLHIKNNAASWTWAESTSNLVLELFCIQHFGLPTCDMEVAGREHSARASLTPRRYQIQRDLRSKSGSITYLQRVKGCGICLRNHDWQRKLRSLWRQFLIEDSFVKVRKPFSSTARVLRIFSLAVNITRQLKTEAHLDHFKQIVNPLLYRLFRSLPYWGARLHSYVS